MRDPSDAAGAAAVRPRARAPINAESLLRQLGSVLGAADDVRFAYLFGSVAKGTSRAGSDVDVAIGFHLPTATSTDRVRLVDRCLELEAGLEAALGRPVQVVALNTAPLALAHNVLSHGRLICSPDEAGRRAFYIAHARRYHDLDHGRRIFARYMSRRIQDGSFGG